MPEKGTNSSYEVRFVRAGAAVLAATLALSGTETTSVAPNDTKKEQDPLPHFVAPPRAAPQSAEEKPKHHTATKKHEDTPVKYWYGPQYELEVVKQLGHAANAKLTFLIAKQRPWFSVREMYCLDSLWYKESKFDEHADNPESDAYGIPEANPGDKMAERGKDWKDNPKTQILWGVVDYIEPTYTTPCGAWSHSTSTGWY